MVKKWKRAYLGGFDAVCHPPPPDAIDPVLDYAHDTTGICVIGGYIYRGRAVRDLRGLYVFGDCFGPDTGDFTGRIFTLRYQGGVTSDFTDRKAGRVSRR